MSRLGQIAVVAAAAMLSACSSVARVGDALWPFGGDNNSGATAPEDGRVSILTFEQQLTPDPALAGRTPLAPAPFANTNWTQPGGAADNSPVSLAGTATLEVARRQDLGAGSDRRVKLAAPPVISNGSLYFLDAEHRVNAFNASTGRQLWNRAMRPRDSEDRRARGGGVAAAGERVYVTSGFGEMVALNAASGEVLWRTAVEAPFHAAPTVSGERVYAVTNDSQLVSFDAATGAIQWTYESIAEPARILSATSPAVEGDTVVAPFASGELVALVAANGRRLWTDSLSRSGRLTSLSAINDIAGRPAVEGGVVYAASHSGILAAIDFRTGARIWSRTFASTQTPWIAGDVLYAVSVDGELAAFDSATGGVFWMQQLRRFEDEDERKGRLSWTGPIMVGGKLILANSVGDVVAVRPETGEIAAERDLRDPIFIPPIAANGLIYLVTDEARLVVLR
jgi:outer membrane protein assembly factor BamB